MQFWNRADAGRRLARLLVGYKKEAPVVLGLPRGGVPVAFEVANALGAPLDVWVVRKVGAPEFPELGVGAVAEGGIVYLNREMIQDLGLADDEIQGIVRKKSAEVAARVKLFRQDRPSPSLAGRTVLLVDDGIATGGTVRAAIQALRATHPGKIVLAVPVAASDTLAELGLLVDDVVCVNPVSALYAIGAWYEDFEQVPDEEVVRLMELSRAPAIATNSESAASLQAMDPREVTIPLGAADLKGTLAGPEEPRGLVLFAHGSGSSRLSPRNRHVAAVLHRYGLATLLFDLLTQEEEAIDQHTGELRFDIGLLSTRLVQATDWARGSPLMRGLPLGYFGASTGAAAALIAAADRPGAISAVVSRGGRPDLAWERLAEVQAPTLLIVGGKDLDVIDLNRSAYARLAAPLRDLVLVPGATHLFEEPGTLDVVARLAGDWFGKYLGRPRPAPEAEAAAPA